MIRRPPRSTLFPYTPLSRSARLRDRPSASLRREPHLGPLESLLERPALLVGAFERARLDVAEAADLLRELGEFHRSEEHTSELQSRQYLVCRLLLEKKTIRHDNPLDSIGTVRTTTTYRTPSITAIAGVCLCWSIRSKVRTTSIQSHPYFVFLRLVSR